ncbi:ABC transporter ATP-binding protein [Shouchella lonarensis]|uniref:Putative ABC transport system ATP-binding protein n=1 Tax=Shouchella lonarensis TaxID=1464122 RepID=A0A1G6HF15_9BACI|nr:ABC transporter ATP-binding protein [Shouchella lonarensis]SDB92708.1 putative ABC transport system ATP-binding protein [Shouchella lonarensis]
MNTICELKHVTKRYGDATILDQVNLKIVEGEMVALTGESGSGKTTILNLIGLLERADEGEVLLFGNARPSRFSRQVTKLLREKIAYSFQHYALIDNGTIDENLEIPLIYSKLSRKEKQKRKLEALKEVGVALPLKQKIYTLSGGEQQRVALARMFLKPCELILADEPTGSLDSDNRDDIMRIFKQLHERGKTIVIVTHDPEVARRCGRIIDLAELKGEARAGA